MSIEAEGVKEPEYKAAQKIKRMSTGERALAIVVGLVVVPIILYAILIIVAGCIFLAGFTFISLKEPSDYHEYDRHELADWESGAYLMTQSETIGKRASYIIPSFFECSDFCGASFYWNDNEKGSEWSAYCMYAVCLDLSFDEKSYAVAKEQALSSHHFLKNPALEKASDGKTLYKMPAAQTMIGGYDVRIIDENPHAWGAKEDEYLTWYPISFGFLAFHDEEMTIRYCYTYNSYQPSWAGVEEFANYLKLNFPVDWE